MEYLRGKTYTQGPVRDADGNIRLDRPARRLAQLQARMKKDILRPLDRYKEGKISASQLRKDLENIIGDYQVYAAYIGSGGDDIRSKKLGRDKEKENARYMMKSVLRYGLGEISEKQLRNNLRMQADALRGTFSRGQTLNVPLLPAYPGEGSECIVRCRCSWQIRKLSGEGNYNARWILGAAERHCPTCLLRSTKWNPIKFRGGEEEGKPLRLNNVSNLDNVPRGARNAARDAIAKAKKLLRAFRRRNKKKKKKKNGS